jgi:hypothetical protein
MRRIVLLTFFLLVMFSVLSLVMAQEPTPPPDNNQTVLSTHPPQMIPAGMRVSSSSGEQIMVEAVTAVSATDSCVDAATLSVPGGGSTIVNGFTVDGGDPNLVCAWGTPKIPTGYRTAWYKFTPTSNGVVTIDTSNSSYDTVVTIFTDKNPNDLVNACSDLLLISCDDDSHGFTSRNQFQVIKNKEYYMQIADWQFGVSGNAELLLSLQVEPLNSFWQIAGNMPLARSRHATAIKGNNIYVIGGQTQNFDAYGPSTPTLTARVDRYNTVTGSWTSLNDMPSPGPNAGYSNTTAAYVSKPNGGDCLEGCIYLPGGFNGGTSYDGTHWAYDIGANTWKEKASLDDWLSWPDGQPFAWSTAVPIPGNTGYYLMGGLSSQPAITDTADIHNKVYAYTVADDKWSDDPPDMLTDRYAHTAVRLGNDICVVGGITNGLVLLDTSECWDRDPSHPWTPIASLNIARYGAGSAVGPDGKWYVFGGAKGEEGHPAASIVEVYDPANPSLGWIMLDANYDLGASGGRLERVWPRGGFVGNYLWAIGGNGTVDSFPAISLIEKLFVAKGVNYLPMLPLSTNHPADVPPDDHFGDANKLAFNRNKLSNFDTISDYFDVYYFTLGKTTAVSIKLSQIPSGSDYNIYLYNNNKQLWGTGDNPSNLDETISVTLSADRYYIIVKRAYPIGFPNTANYKLIVEK